MAPAQIVDCLHDRVVRWLNVCAGSVHLTSAVECPCCRIAAADVKGTGPLRAGPFCEGLYEESVLLALFVRDVSPVFLSCCPPYSCSALRLRLTITSAIPAPRIIMYGANLITTPVGEIVMSLLVNATFASALPISVAALLPK